MPVELNASSEAKSFYGMYLRGTEADKLRADIGVSDRTILIWRVLSQLERDRTAATALRVRRLVLRQFDALVRAHEQHRQPKAA
jgi:hypothetical protein